MGFRVHFERQQEMASNGLLTKYVFTMEYFAHILSMENALILRLGLQVFVWN